MNLLYVFGEGDVGERGSSSDVLPPAVPADAGTPVEPISVQAVLCHDF